MSRSRRLLHVLAAGFALALAQVAPALGDEALRITITQLDATDFPNVRVTGSVIDTRGRAIQGLRADDLEVLEEGVPLRVRVELASEVAPVALVLALDTSASMADRAIVDAKSAIASMIQALGPQDRAALITFDGRVSVAQPLTSDKGALVAATNAASTGGDTAVYDALTAATELLKDVPASARRAVVLLTDGFDTASRTSRAEARARASAAGMPIYVVGLGSAIDRQALQSLADASSGGRLFVAPSSADLGAIYAGLSQQLRTEYSVTYRSPLAHLSAGARIQLTLRLVRQGRVLSEVGRSYEVPARPAEPAPPQSLNGVAPPLPAPPQAAAPGRDERVAPPELTGLLAAATILMLLLWLLEMVDGRAQRQRRRLEMFVRRLVLTPPEHDKRRSIVQRLIVPSFRSVGRPFLRIAPAAFLTRTRARLQQAGEPLGLGPVEFLGVRLGFAMLGGIAGLAVTLLGGPAFGFGLASSAGGALFGYALPAFVLDLLTRRRKHEIRRALPTALDMLALSVQAGLSFDGALAQVAHRWSSSLSNEFRRVLLEFQMGRDRRQVLSEFAERTGVPDVGRFTSAVVQADSLGVPLSTVLREQAVDMRVRRRQRAEEVARQASVKMLFPLVFLIFPALFAVILGPAVPRLLAVFEIAY